MTDDELTILSPSQLQMRKLGGEAHRITCPYCQAGAAVVVMDKWTGGGEVKVQVDLKEPRKCDLCGRYFKLKPTTTLVGVPLDYSSPKGDRP
jgi:uncharacterized Zn-finger protein